jgi:hypothetical protein
MTTFTKIFDGVADRETCFALLNRYQRDSAFAGLGLVPGQWFEITEEEYWYFLEVLPPLDMTGGAFAMSEFTSMNLTESFYRIGDRYFCCLLDWQGRGSLVEAKRAIFASFNFIPA